MWRGVARGGPRAARPRLALGILCQIEVSPRDARPHSVGLRFDGAGVAMERVEPSGAKLGGMMILPSRCRRCP